MSDGSERGPGRAAWLVRGGEHGEREEMALARGLVIAGWEELGDIGDCETREGIRGQVRKLYAFGYAQEFVDAIYASMRELGIDVGPATPPLTIEEASGR